MTEKRPSLLPITIPEVRSHATLSHCGTYRYTLMRRWAAGPPLRFVMLNPSTADAEVDDPTIRRCIGFAKREGFPAIVVLNLYAFRATDPKALLTCSDAVGPENDSYLFSHLAASAVGPTPVVAAWGANAPLDRVRHVLSMIPVVDWRCLGMTKDGAPRHPLYLRNDAPMLEYPRRTVVEKGSSDG